MRTFIAIELPPEIKDFLSQIQERLKKSGADVKWVAPENIHLTLKFLGETNEKKIDRISEIMQEVARDKSAFSIRLSSLGAFPKINSPRVIWVGVDQGGSESKEIAAELEEKIAKVGIPKEDRPFSSHITIGRTRSNLNLEKLVQELNNVGKDFREEIPEFRVGNLTFFKSTLTPKGPIYNPLNVASLKTT